MRFLVRAVQCRMIIVTHRCRQELFDRPPLHRKNVPITMHAGYAETNMLLPPQPRQMQKKHLPKQGGHVGPRPALCADAVTLPCALTLRPDAAHSLRQSPIRLLRPLSCRA